eukprot:TRINITY_DN1790_c1_g4_i1.p1 TRINITY_DN1790_c1_g4~~TRINITY_DN1790_c1_g4_i1.p1  ORF type:complete len:571 (+),score=183.33 TRINITY_DN1790_c1_g4_i1:52-1764(+)
MLSQLLGLALAGVATAGAAPQGIGGNILFLMCDSMDGRVLDPTSSVSERLEMPHFRALSDRGVNFVRTYAASPQCVPSRTTMFTGRHTHEIKAWANEQGLAGNPRGGLDKTCVHYWGVDMCQRMAKEQNVTFTMLDAMQDVGYDFEIFGKVDVGAGVVAKTTWGTATGFHGGPTANIMTRTADIRKPTKPDPITITNDEDNNVHPEDQKMFPRCIDFLKNAASAGADAKPWLLYCSLNIPHPAFQTNATWLQMVHEDKIPNPTWPNETCFHPADSYMSESKNVWREYSEEQILKVRKTYYAMCSETDYMLGEVIDAMHTYGFADNTWVVFVSDHGEMNMEHRQVWKNSMYEASSRVPFIIVPPEGMPGVRRGVTATNITSLLDVLPTLVDMAQTDIAKPIHGGASRWYPGHLSGHSLLPLVAADADAAARAADYPFGRSILAQYHSNMGNTGSFMYRSGPWKYLVFGRHAYDPTYVPQLFNVDADPEEVHDVSDANPDVVARLDSELRAIIDYNAVDREARTNDLTLYKYWSKGRSRAEIMKAMGGDSGYQGFDDADMKKVEDWVKNGGQ